MAGRISVFGLLSVATLISANPVPYPIAVPYLSKREDNATLQGHRPKDFSGCSSAQTSFINQAYADALTLASNLYPFLPPHDELSANNASTTGGVSGVGVLEQRFLAATSSWQHDSDANDPAQLVRNIVYNIAPGYFDYFRYQIQVSCVDIPNKRNTRCASDAGEGKPIGAYALSENGGPQIVVCSPFFETPVGDGSLAGVKAVVDQDPNKQKDPAWWKTAGHIYFHEMTHLSTIEDKPAGTVVVKDQPANPVEGYGRRTYGPKASESLAKRFPAYAPYNADNLAWYATTKYFAQFYGTPPSLLKPNTFSNSTFDDYAAVLAYATLPDAYD